MKISIITATFNSAATVRDTLDSILRQTHQDWELIIEDGLSKDDTLAIVREYEPRCLEDINRAMDGQPVDCIYGDLMFVQAGNKERVVRIWKGSQHKKGAFLRGWHPAHPTFYARREFFTHLGAFDTSYAVSADFELMLRFIEVAGLRNRYLPRFFVKMRMGGESTGSLRNIIRGNRSILRALRHYGFRPSPLFVLQRMLPKLWASITGRLHSAL